VNAADPFGFSSARTPSPFAGKAPRPSPGTEQVESLHFGRTVAVLGDGRSDAKASLSIRRRRPSRGGLSGQSSRATAETDALPRNHPRTGLRKNTVKEYLRDIGWRWTPTMHIGSGCKVHLRAGELPPGRLIVALSKHLCAVIDGVIHDTHDCSRGGRRSFTGIGPFHRPPREPRAIN